MDEYVGGISANYTTNQPLLARGLELLAMLREDLDHLGAEDLHQLQRAWELHHRVLASECVTRHTLFRTETRWPGYYYRADHPRLDDANWHCFTLSRLRPRLRRVGAGEGSPPPHHRLTADPPSRRSSTEPLEPTGNAAVRFRDHLARRPRATRIRCATRVAVPSTRKTAAVGYSKKPSSR